MPTIGSIQLPEFPLLLAPMEDVSDPPFRAVCKDNGADLMYSEFISSEGLIRDAMKSMKKLDFEEEERPFGIQIFGGDEDAMEMSARICDAVNPDLVDINFGCPVKKVVNKGAGAGFLKDLVRRTIKSKSFINGTRLPVTIKTRLGWDDNTRNIEEVAERMQDIGVQAIAIHGRTRCQLYKGEADWSLIAKVKNNPRITIPVFGNGDIDSPQKAKLYKERYGVDGIMIGRAAIGYPWIFREIKHYLNTGEILPAPTLEERILVCKKHLERSIKWKGQIVGINEMRRHYTNYLKGLPNIKEFRMKLVTLNEPADISDVLDEVSEHYKEHSFERTPIELINYHEKCPV